MLDFNEGILEPFHVRAIKSKFFYLLCALIIYFVGTALLTGSIITNLINSIFLSFIILFSIYPFLKQTKMLFIAVMLGCCIVSSHFTLLFYEKSEAIFVFLYAACFTFLSLITYSVIVSITQHQKVTLDSLFGAICGYFLIGFTWTFIYLLIEAIYPFSFSSGLLEGSIHERSQHFIYFSFTTMTTLGYGDILPLRNISRTFSWLEAIVGQIYLAVWISQLVGLRITQELKK